MSDTDDKEPMTAGDYGYDAESGTIYRKGKEIAKRDPETKAVEFYNKECGKFRLPTSKAMKSMGVEVSAYSTAESVDEPEAPKSTVSPTAPPKPKTNPRDGDKTPALVEWYRKYDPEEYKRRYQVQKSDVEMPVFDKETGEQISTRTVDIAFRKTPTTEKIENTDKGDGHDWSQLEPSVSQ